MNVNYENCTPVKLKNELMSKKIIKFLEQPLFLLSQRHVRKNAVK